MKKSFAATSVTATASRASIAAVIADAREELKNERKLDLQPEQGGYNWPEKGYGATIRVANTPEGLMFLAEAVEHGHFNQAALEELWPEDGYDWENDAFTGPVILLGCCSFGHRWVSKEFEELSRGYIGEDTWEHRVFLLAEDAPVGTQATIGSATSGSEVTITKVSSSFWELHLWVPEEGGAPYEGWYYQCVRRALEAYWTQVA